MTKYNLVLVDKIFCESFINWTYEEADETIGKKGVYSIHLKSAIRKSKEQHPILTMTSKTREDLEKQYINNERNMHHLDSIISASDEIIIPLDMQETEAILKSASLLKWKNEKFCILTGNSLIMDLAKKSGFDVFDIKDSEKVLKDLIE